jgi:hypothetical protein
MSGQGRGGGGGRYGGRGTWKKPSGGQQAKDGVGGGYAKADKPSAKIYQIGSVKQSSDFSVFTKTLVSFIRRTYDHGDDIAKALETKLETDLSTLMPTMQRSMSKDDATKAHEDEQNKIVFTGKIAEHMKRKAAYIINTTKAYALIYEHCSKSLQSKLTERSDFETTIKNKPIAILEAIEKHSMSYMENK